ncbi:MAG: hypothetical protein LBV26_00815 [Bacteroidales bacterium]|jgi:uncharacterized protein (TIGR02145 family)|nr:hypothetical protein [Bacteroidales bacterium]
MKRFFKTSLNVVFAVMLAAALLNCKKKEKETPPDTTPAVPVSTTDTASYIGQAWATLNSITKAGNLMTTVLFEYDTDTNQTTFRYTIAASPDTVSGNSLIRRAANLTGLAPNTTYYYRATATNSLGKSAGKRQAFTTLDVQPGDIAFNPDIAYGEMTDIEGNTYKTVETGSHTWMAENLAVTRYSDGSPIPLVIADTYWKELSSGAYSWPDNVEIKYGALYNWHAVNSGQLCPDGWRVPTDDDWTALVDYLGGATTAGGKLKEAGYAHWTAPNTGATNITGFTALPAGYKSAAGAYGSKQRYGYWWTATPDGASAIARSLYYDYANINRTSADKHTGASVRCIKEQ